MGDSDKSRVEGITSGIQNLGIGPKGAEGIDDKISEISDVKEVKKIHYFSYVEELSRLNVRYWLDAIEEQLELQDAKEAIRKYQGLGKDMFIALMDRKPGWRKLNLKAKAIMRSSMSKSTRLNLKSVETAGELMEKVKEIYGKPTMTDQKRAIMAELNWKKDPSMSVIQAWENFERIDQERLDVTNIHVDSKVLMSLFLPGLGPEYRQARENILIQVWLFQEQKS